MTLVYLIITAVSAFFYVMYKGDLSFVLFVFLLAAPLLLHLLLAVCSAFVKITVLCDAPVTEKDSAAAVRVRIRNRSFLPVSSCKVKLVYSVSAPFEDSSPAVRTAVLPIGGRSEETLLFRLLPEHCGTVSVKIKYAALRDLMGITSLRKKINFRTDITVLPRIFPAEKPPEADYVYNAESGIFSKEKPGDDPSEIFMLREYRDGDRHNLIHWKLSGRNENFIVRELSKPVSSRTLIIADFGGCKDADGADRVFETAASLSAFLAENGSAHFIAVPLSDGGFKTSEITDEDSFYAAVTELSREIKGFGFNCSEERTAELYGGAFFVNGGFSRVVAVSERRGGRYEEMLSGLFGETRLTVINASGEKNGE